MYTHNTVNATRLKNYKNEHMLVSVGLRVAAVAISICALTCSGGMIVLWCVNKQNRLSNINMRNFAVAPKPSVSIIKTKKLNSLTCSIFILSIFRVSIFTFLFVFWNVIYLDFAMFNDNLFILSHSFIFKSLSFIKDSKLS